MKLIHNYVLEKQLCENDIVRVFRAKEKETEKLFTLSLVNEAYEISPKFLMRMISGDSQSQMIHPHVAAVVDYGEIDSQQYFVSDYIGCETLSSFLGKPVSVAFALDTISQLASGLHFLSLQGYAHGNIHPDNIFFDSYGNAILLALELVPKNSAEHKPLFSRYHSPEYIEDNVTDELSDLYSLGVLLFEMITAERFDERSYIATSDVDNVNELIPYLPEDNFGFQPVINKLLAKQPKQRYRNGLQLVDALNEYDSRLSNVSEMDFSPGFAEEIVDSSLRQPVAMENLNEPGFDAGADPDFEKSPLHIPSLNLGSDFSMPNTERGIFWSNFAFSIPEKLSIGNRKYMLGGGVFAALMFSLIVFFPRNENPAKMDLFLADNTETGAGSTALATTKTEHVVLEHVTPEHVTSEHVTSEHVTSEHVTSEHVTSEHVTSEHVTSEQVARDMEITDFELTDAVKKRQAPVEDPRITKAEVNAMPVLVGQLQAHILPLLISERDVEDARASAIKISEEIDSYLQRARVYLSELKFTRPKDNNAYAMYEAILNIDPDNVHAMEGIADIADAYAYMANRQIIKKNYEKAKKHIEKGLKVQAGNESLIALQMEVDQLLEVVRSPEPLGVTKETVAFDP